MLCDENWNPNLLLYCDQNESGIPFRTQFKIAGSVPVKYGIQASFSFQSLPGYRFGTAALNIDAGIVAGPSGQPGALSLANPNGAGHGVADHADDQVQRAEPMRRRRAIAPSVSWSIPA